VSTDRALKRGPRGRLIRRDLDDNLRGRVVVRDIGELHVQIAVVGRELRESHAAALGSGVNLFE